MITITYDKSLSLSSLISQRLTYMLIGTLLTSLIISAQNASAGGGHDLPPASIGDRKASLSVKSTPEIASVSDRVNLSYTFTDQTAGKAISHVTYVVTINDSSGNRIFSEVVHGHDGAIDLQFRRSDAKPYKVNANYDNLAASYVSDFGSPIVIDGAVLSNPGSYKAIIEVTGIDFDNTFLPDPIKYEYNFSVLENQSFQVDYEGRVFNLDILSPVQISTTEFKPENRQLIMTYPGTDAIHLDDFRVVADIPKEMMAGPFTASFGNGGQLDVREESISDDTVRLIMNGTHLDVTQQDGQSQDEENSSSGSMANMHSMQTSASSDMPNAIVITSTTVVPEFPLGLPLVSAVALAAVLAFFKGREKRFLNRT